MTELELVRKAQTGDDDAYQRLVEMHQSKVYHLLLGILREPHIAQELTQVTFIKAWRSLNRFRCDACFWTWLYRIAYHSAMDYLRVKRAIFVDWEANESTASEKLEPLETVIKSEQRQDLLAALQILPFHQRTAVVLYYFQGFSYEEIAHITGRKLDTIRSDLLRGKAGLKTILTRKWSECGGQIL